MSEQTITQTQTLADVETDWTNTVGVQQFDPSQGSLQAVGVGVIGNVNGSGSIENLGPTTTWGACKAHSPGTRLLRSRLICLVCKRL